MLSRRSLIIATPALILPSRLIAKRGLFPALPQEAIEKGFTTITNFDHFDNPNTIDVNNTQASGFNFYIQSYFAGASYANPAPPWGALGSSDIDISNSVLTIKTDVSGFAEGLVSTIDNNIPFANRAHPLPGDADGPYYSVDPTAFKGWAFRNGAVISYAFRFNPIPFLTPTSPWVSVWSTSQAFLTGADQQGAGINNRLYTELDFFEAILWNNPCMALNAWSNLRPSVGSPTFTTNSTAFNPIPGVDWDQWNIMDNFWCPMNANSGTGFLHRYLNGVHIPSFDVSWQAGDVFSDLDTQTNAMILGAGVNHQVQFDWIRIAQRSMSDIVIQ